MPVVAGNDGERTLCAGWDSDGKKRELASKKGISEISERMRFV